MLAEKILKGPLALSIKDAPACSSPLLKAGPIFFSSFGERDIYAPLGYGDSRPKRT